MLLRVALCSLAIASASVAATAGAAASDRSFSAYITGYSYWDNTPPGSAAISNPIIHSSAGGTGTFADPITIAVGHVISGGKNSLDYPAGTRFYIKALRKYAIVEDTCGDGGTPQNSPCHTGHQGRPWLDIYVDGASIARPASLTCANNITAVHTVIENPGPDYSVAIGAIAETGCRKYDE